jgi:predicted GIY-YIG superfamily endonuclease
MASSRFPDSSAAGTIYLLHFSGKTSQGRQHYLGWSSNPDARLTRHRSGVGAGETRKAVAEGLRITQAQTWKGTPLLEQRLKEWSRHGRKGFSGICPFCPGDAALPPDLARELGEPSLVRYSESA